MNEADVKVMQRKRKSWKNEKEVTTNIFFTNFGVANIFPGRVEIGFEPGANET